MEKRILSLDLLRGIGLVGVVFLHGALYHFGGLFGLDMDNPPLTVTIIGFLLMWAGLFAVISSFAYAFRLFDRLTNGVPIKKLARDFLLKGVLVLILAQLYFVFVGPAILNFDTHTHLTSVFGGLFRTGHFSAFSFERFSYLDSLSMLAWNLVFLGLAVWWIKPTVNTRKRFSWLLLVVGAGIVLLSAVRIPFYTWYENFIQEGPRVVVWLVSQVVNKNNPILPYVGFGFMGAAFGMFAAEGWQSLRKKWATIIGVIWFVGGVVTMLLLPETMLERSIDWTWFAIMLLQLGLFILVLIGAQKLIDAPNREKFFLRRATWLRRFGVIPLTVFFIETPLREAYAHLWNIVWPEWNSSMGVTLIFAATIAVIWFVIVWLWEKAKYVGSLEWLLMWVYRKMKLLTNKPEAILNEQKIPTQESPIEPLSQG